MQRTHPESPCTLIQIHSSHLHLVKLQQMLEMATLHATNHVVHNTKNEAVVTSTLRMTQLYHLQYRCTLTFCVSPHISTFEQADQFL
jgi:hypothetical protein